jgi:hypothetical protein
MFFAYRVDEKEKKSGMALFGGSGPEPESVLT